MGFGEYVVYPEEMVTLMVTVGRHSRCRTVPINFAVVKADYPYNLLIGRPTLNTLKAVYSTCHLNFKFPTSAGIIEVSSDICSARECYLATMQAAANPGAEPNTAMKRSNVLSIDCINAHETGNHGRLETGDEIEKVILDTQKSGQIIRVGTSLLSPLKEEMINLFREHQDVFAWKADKVVGVLQSSEFRGC